MSRLVTGPRGGSLRRLALGSAAAQKYDLPVATSSPKTDVELLDSVYVLDVSTHLLFVCRILADPGIVRDGSGTSFLGPRGRVRVPGRGFEVIVDPQKSFK